MATKHIYPNAIHVIENKAPVIVMSDICYSLAANVNHFISTSPAPSPALAYPSFTDFPTTQPVPRGDLTSLLQVTTMDECLGRV